MTTPPDTCTDVRHLLLWVLLHLPVVVDRAGECVSQCDGARLVFTFDGAGDGQVHTIAFTFINVIEAFR